MIDEAKRLIAIGLPIIPLCSPKHENVSPKHLTICKCPGKMPLIKNWQVRETTTEENLKEWIHQFKTFNIGLPLGDASGYCGIDVDGEIGEQFLQQMSNGDLPDTWEFTTGSGRRLLYLIPPGTKTKKFKKEDKDGGHKECALLCTGQQTVIPPSVHFTGKIYQWKENHSPWDLDCAMAPQWLVDKIKKTDVDKDVGTEFNLNNVPTLSNNIADEFTTTDFSDNIPVEILNNESVVKTQNVGKSGHKIIVTDKLLESTLTEGHRDDTMTAIVGHYCANRDFRRLGKDFIIQVCLKHNKEHCDPPLDDEVIIQKVNYFWEIEQSKDSKYKQNKGAKLQFEASKAAGLVRRELQNRGIMIHFDQFSKMYYYTTADKGPWICTRDSNVINHWIRQIIINPEYGNPAWDKRNFVDETRRALEEAYTEAFRDNDEFDIGAHSDKLSKYIVLNNGMLDWQTKQLLPWNPNYHTVISFDIDYDPTAKCPRFEKYVSEWLPSESVQKVLQEFLGYCLIPNTKFRKALFLYGKGKNGKSMLLEFLQKFFGEHKATLSYDGLYQRFGPANLKGKLVNLFDDTTVTFAKDTGIVKNLIAGGTISAEFKGKDHFTFTNVARFIFSAQETPKTADHSDAWYDRWIFIKFPNKFKASNEKKIEMETAMEEEKAGIFNWMVEGLTRLIQNDGFSNSEDLLISSQEYRNQNDSVSMFLTNLCQENENELGTPINILYQIYTTWSDFEGLRSLSKRTFIERIQDLGYKKKKGYVSRKSGQTYIEHLIINKECENYEEHKLEYAIALQTM